MRRILLGAALWLSMSVASFAETQSVIDPTEGLEPPKAAAPGPDASLRRERQRAEAEQRRRAKAEARALAAEKESARLRAQEQARQAEAQQAEARKAAAARAAATRAAAARATQARIAAENDAARRQAAARETAARELAAREAALRETAAREAAERDAAAREAKQIAAREAAARLVAAREAAAREATTRNTGVRLAAARDTARDERFSKTPPRLGANFRDCNDCPELIWLPRGEFVMGDGQAENGPRPLVAINYMLAVGRFEVTFAEWDACVAGGGCRRNPHDSGWGRGWQPVINVSWADAQQYVAWLSRRTGKRYRLLTEAEWEYAARAGTEARYWWGNQAGRGDANCADCGSKWDGRQAAPVGRFAPNPFGLYDMHGNVSEWVEDCYHEELSNAPADGRAWTRDCTVAGDTRIVRGGAWHGSSKSMRSTSRTSAAADYFDNRIGFRIARSE